MDEALCHCLFVTLLPRHEGRPNGADHLATRRGCRRRGHPAVLPERLDAPPADRDGRVRRAVSHDPRRRIRLPAHGRVVGKSYAIVNNYIKQQIEKGVDGKTVDGFSVSHIEQLIDTLKNETYQPKPSQRVYIPKKNGKKRPL